MSTLKALEQALLNAESAGNTEDAKVLAGEISRLTGYTPPPDHTGTAFVGGIERTGQYLGNFVDVLTGDTEGVLERAADPAERTQQQMAFGESLQEREEAAGETGSIPGDLWQAIKNVAGAAVDEPRGALHEFAAQLPYAAPAVGGSTAGAAAGAKLGAVGGTAIAGPVGTAVGGTIGGLAGFALGRWFGTMSVETGMMAEDLARDGIMTEEELDLAAKRGMIKGGVITAADMASLGLNTFIGGGPARIAEKAITKNLLDKGVDVASHTALRKALADPVVRKGAEEAGKVAIDRAMAGVRKVGRTGLKAGVEMTGEGAGEYLGTAAAGLDPSMTEAVLEGLMAAPIGAADIMAANKMNKPGPMQELFMDPKVGEQIDAEVAYRAQNETDYAARAAAVDRDKALREELLLNLDEEIPYNTFFRANGKNVVDEDGRTYGPPRANTKEAGKLADSLNKRVIQKQEESKVMGPPFAKLALPAPDNKLQQRLEKAARNALKGYGLERAGVTVLDRLKSVEKDSKGNLMYGVRIAKDEQGRAHVVSDPDPDLSVEAAFVPWLNEVFVGVDNIRSRALNSSEQGPVVPVTKGEGEFGALTDDQIVTAVLEELNHEKFHLLRYADLLTQKELEVLENAATNEINAQTGRTFLFDTANPVDGIYAKNTPTIQMEEAIANLTREVIAGRHTIAGKPRSLMRRIVEFFKRLVRVQVDSGIDNAKDLMTAIASGQIAERERGVVRTLRETEYRKGAPERGIPAPPPRQVPVAEDDTIEDAEVSDELAEAMHTQRQQADFTPWQQSIALWISQGKENDFIMRFDAPADLSNARILPDVVQIPGYLLKKVSKAIDKQAKHNVPVQVILKLPELLENFTDAYKYYPPGARGKAEGVTLVLPVKMANGDPIVVGITDKEIKSIYEFEGGQEALDKKMEGNVIPRHFITDFMGKALYSKRRDGSVGYSQKAMDELFSQYGYANGSAHAAIAYVNPKEFLSATTPDFLLREAVSKTTDQLNTEKLKEPNHAPFVFIAKEKDGGYRIPSTWSHEGRHRMLALARSGATKVPVVFRADWAYTDDSLGLPENGEIRGANKESYERLKEDGLDFPNTAVMRFSDSIDITYDNRTKIEAEYGADDGVMFSKRGTNTPKFKKWFGDSKAVNADGSPAVFNSMRKPPQAIGKPPADIDTDEFQRWWRNSVVAARYDDMTELRPEPVIHGSMSEFDQFRPEYVGRTGAPDAQVGEAYFFTDSPWFAEMVARSDKPGMLPTLDFENEPYAYEVYLRIENPYIWSNEDIRFGDGTIVPDESGLIPEAMAQVIRTAKAKGKDGIIFKNDTMGKTFVVFNQNQIKSVYNEGVWSDEPDIFHSQRKQGIRRPTRLPHQSYIGFYSAAEKAVLDTDLPGFNPTKKNPDGAAPGAEIWSRIKKTQGVKEEELKWLGLEEFLTGQEKKKFTRDEVSKYIRENGVAVDENIAEDEGYDYDPEYQDFIWSDAEVVDEPEMWEYQTDDAVSDFLNADGNLDIPINTWMEDWIDANPDVVFEHYDIDIDNPSAQMTLAGIDNYTPEEALEQIKETAIDDMRLRELAEDDFRRYADEYYHKQYLEDPVMLRELFVEGEDTDLYIWGNDDSGYSIRHGGTAYADNIASMSYQEIWSLSEAEMQAQDYAYENEIIATRDGGNEDVKWGEEQYNAAGDYENYREIKLTLPEIDGDFYKNVHFPDRNIVAFIRADDRSIETNKQPVVPYVRISHDMQEIADRATGKKVSPYFSTLEQAEEALSTGDFEKYTRQVKDMFFIEEMQSDWHQQGRNKGYKLGERSASDLRFDAIAKLEAMENEFEEMVADHGEAVGIEYVGQDASGEIFAVSREPAGTRENVGRNELRESFFELVRKNFKWDRDKVLEKYESWGGDLRQLYIFDGLIRLAEAVEKVDKKWLYGLRDRLNEYDALQKQAEAEISGVPNVPFKKEAWARLALKRAIMYAVNEGKYDAIAWPNSLVVADRWSDRYIEMYQNQYDKLMPKIAKELLRDYGIEVQTLDMKGENADISKQTGMFYAEFNDEFKEAVEQDGFPLFSRRAGKLSAHATGGITMGAPQEGAKSYPAILYRGAMLSNSDAEDTFYIQKTNKGMPKVKRTGEHVYSQRFNNILDELSELGEELRSRAERGGVDFEAAVVNAGFDGYANENTGILKLLKGPAPVNYLGTRTGLAAKGFTYLDMLDVEPRIAEGETGAPRIVNVDEPEQSRRKGLDFPDITDAQHEAMERIKFIPATRKERFDRRMDRAKHRTKTRIRQTVVDQYSSLRDVLEDPKAWMLARLTASSPGAVDALINYGIPDIDANGVIQIDTTRKGLLEAMKPLGNEVDRWLTWVAANRAKKLKAEEREALFRDQDINALIKLNENTMEDGRDRNGVYQSVLRDFNAINRAVVGIAVKSGMANKEEATKWLEDGFYLPFYRVLNEIESSRGPRGLNQQGLVKQQAIKRLSGSDAPLRDLLENQMMNWNHLIGTSLRNNAARQAIATAQNIQDDNGDKIARRVNKRNSSNDAIFVRENGVPVYYEISNGRDGALVLDSLMALEWVGLSGKAYDYARGLKRILTTGVTASPEYKLRNLIRDTIQSIAVASMSKDFIGNLRMGWKHTRKNSPYYAQAMASGAIFPESGYMHGGDPDLIRFIVKKHGVNRDSILTEGRGWGKLLFDKYQDFGLRLENVNRMARYVQGRERGESSLESAFGARDLLDFSATGSATVVRGLAQTVSFLNSRLQGLDKLARAAKSPGQQRQFIQVTMTYMAFSMLSYMLMRDDDRYKDLPDWMKDTYHIVPGPDKELIKIPRPFEVGVMGTMAERALEQMMLAVKGEGIDPELFLERLTFAITQTFAINPVPQAFWPAVESFANYNMFTQRPIENASMQRLSPELRHQPWTSPSAIGISEGLNAVGIGMSPLRVDHLVRGYLGWMGSNFLMGTTDLMTNAVSDLKGGPSRPTKHWTDTPVIKALVTRGVPKSSKYVDMLYENAAETDRAMADVKEYRNRRMGPEMREAIADNRDLLGKQKSYANAKRKLAEIKKAQQHIYRSKSMSSEEKARRIERLDEQKNRLARIVVEKLD